MIKGNIVTNYLAESVAELRKVTWPTREHTARLTVITLIFCLVMAIFLGALDYVFNFSIRSLIALF